MGEINHRDKLSGRNALTLKEIAEFIENTGPEDAIIIIATNGVKDPDFKNQKQKVDVLTYCGNVKVAATAIVNHALNFGESEYILGLCRQLQEVANNSMHNISIELNHRAKNN